MRVKGGALPFVGCMSYLGRMDAYTRGRADGITDALTAIDAYTAAAPDDPAWALAAIRAHLAATRPADPAESP